MSIKESRDFRISNNMIFHLVFSQAGTVAKSLGELVMNSQDAGADTFELTIDNNGFVAKDNGRGFQTRDEIEKWFEELGFDHSDELHQEEGRFSRFGLGRAQCMAFASTQWYTNTFLMDVDIKERGISYDLEVNQPKTQGCLIKGKWYDTMGFADLQTTLRELEELIAYIDISVIVNGKKINRTDTRWDYETDKVYVRRKESGGLAVYNQGVLIRHYPAYQYGSGIVVSKIPFTLNMARNDILQSSCPAWKEVRTLLREEAISISKKKKRLNDDERQLLIDQWVAGEVSNRDILDTPLLEDVTGRKYKLNRIFYKKPFTIHTTGPKLAADRIQQTKQAFVLSNRSMESFGAATPEQFQEIIKRAYSKDCGNGPDLHYIPIDSLIDTQESGHLILKANELTKVERVVLGALRQGFSDLQRAVNFASHGHQYMDYAQPRTLYVGESESAEGWTDGNSYVAINRNYLRTHARKGIRGFIALNNLLVHELCHESNTATAHDHGAEFFETFHDVLCGVGVNSYGTAVRKSQRAFLTLSQKEGLKLSKDEAGDMDTEVAIDREVYDDTEFLDMDENPKMTA